MSVRARRALCVVAAACAVAACVEDVTLARVPVVVEAGVDAVADLGADVARDVVDASVADTPDVLDVTDVPDVPDVPITTQWTLRATCSARGEYNAAASAVTWQCTASLDDPRGPVAGSALHLTVDGVEVDATTTAPGRFTATGTAWPARWTFRASTSGSRWSEAFDAPGFHQFTSPAHLARVPRLTPLPVRWAPAGADEATFVAPTPARDVPDTGSATLAGEHFVEVLEMNIPITLRRARTVAPAGLAAGSTIRFEVTNGISVHPD